MNDEADKIGPSLNGTQSAYIKKGFAKEVNLNTEKETLMIYLVSKKVASLVHHRS